MSCPFIHFVRSRQRPSSPRIPRASRCARDTRRRPASEAGRDRCAPWTRAVFLKIGWLEETRTMPGGTPSSVGARDIRSSQDGRTCRRPAVSREDAGARRLSFTRAAAKGGFLVMVRARSEDPRTGGIGAWIVSVLMGLSSTAGCLPQGHELPCSGCGRPGPSSSLGGGGSSSLGDGGSSSLGGGGLSLGDGAVAGRARER